jgi:ELWxxDGT repeat protein
MPGRSNSFGVRLAVLVAVAGIAAAMFAAPVSAVTGAYLVRDVKAGGRSSNPMYLTPVGDTLFFSAKGPKGRELWKSDGTQAGTIRVKDIFPGEGSSNPYALTNVNGKLFFAADDGSHGIELWTSDGTAAGTSMVEDISPGTSDFVESLTAVAGQLLFFRIGATSQELWTSSGTADNTSLVAVVEPVESASGSPTPLLVEGSALIFGMRGPDGYMDIWKSDGTPGGTARMDFTNWANWLIRFEGLYYFTSLNESYGTELWKTDGTAVGTELVKDIDTTTCSSGATCSSEPSKPVVLNGKMYFIAYTGGFERRSLWASDGTEEGTTEVKPLLWAEELTKLGSKLVFSGQDETSEAEVWRTNGTAAGTKLVKAIGADGWFGSSPHGFVKVGNRLYFVANPTVNPFDEGDAELWRTDGTTAGTKLVMDIDPTGSSSPESLTNVGGTLYFSADDGSRGRELWRYVP